MRWAIVRERHGSRRFHSTALLSKLPCADQEARAWKTVRFFFSKPQRPKQEGGHYCQKEIMTPQPAYTGA